MTDPREAVAARHAQLPFVVFADFVCPWSFLTVHQVARLAAEYGIRPIWRPHWLHPDVPPEGRAIDDLSRRDATVAWLTECAPDLAPDMQFADRIVSSLPAFEALEFAVDRQCSFPFAAAVFDAGWRLGDDISRVDTLQRAAARVGLDAAELATALSDRTYARRVAQALAVAQRLDVTATPTVFIGTTRINGWHYDEVLRRVLAELDIHALPARPS
jgi:predicted DsbA family dithiol-disulfide isomerase